MIRARWLFLILGVACSAAFAMIAASSAKADMLNLECHFANERYLNAWQVFWIDFDKGTITFGIANAQGVDPATMSTFPVTITPQAFEWNNCGHAIINRITGIATMPACFGSIANTSCVKGTTPFPAAATPKF